MEELEDGSPGLPSEPEAERGQARKAIGLKGANPPG